MLPAKASDKLTTLRFILVAAAVFATSFIHAQYNDAGLWLGANIEKKISGKFALNVNPELRFDENMTELGNAFIDVAAIYKISRGIRFAINYRFSRGRQLENHYLSRHRYYADLYIKKKFGQISLGYRLRAQSQYSGHSSRRNGPNATSALRNKLLLKYDMEKRYTPFVSSELWYEIEYRDNVFNRFRIVTGVDYEVNKFTALTLSYLFQRRFNMENPRTDYILSLSYNYSF